MYSHVWRFCVVAGVTNGLVWLWFHHPVMTMLGLPVAAAYVLLLVRVWHWTFNSDSEGPTKPPPPPRSVWLATVVGFGVAGLLHLEVLLGLAGLVVAVLTSPWAISHWITEGRQIAVGAPAAGAKNETRSHLDLVLAELDDPQLCLRWQQSFVDLKLSEPDRRWRVVELRAAYLDEMTRRHPRAMSAWLADGGHAWANPRAYFKDSA